MRPRGRRVRGAPYTLMRATVIEPLRAAGLFTVHAADGPATRIFYCEPATGRCSCGAPDGSCPHIASVNAVLTPSSSRHGAA